MEKTIITSIIVILSISLTVVTGMAIHERQKRQNYDALLKNKAFVESQINCVLGRGQCDRIGHRIKVLVPEVVKTNFCKSCTEEEKGNVQKVADHVQNHYPKAWNEIRVQYKDELEEEEAGGEEEDETMMEEGAENVNEETAENSVPTETTSTVTTLTAKDDENAQNQDESAELNNQENNSESDSQGQQQGENLEDSQDNMNPEQEQKLEDTKEEKSKKDVVDTTDNVTN